MLWKYTLINVLSATLDVSFPLKLVKWVSVQATEMDK